MVRRALAVVTPFVLSCAPTRSTVPPGAELPNAPAMPDASLVIRDVRVFDGAQVLPRTSVWIDDGHIVAIDAEATPPAGAEIVDGGGRTLLPGLIDAHAHAHSGADLEQAAVFGVTCELDMMGDPAFVASRRRRKPGAKPLAADLFGAGFAATPKGGHGTEYGGAVPTLDRAKDAAAFVAARVKEGSDYLKIVYDDGFGPIEFARLDEPSLRAVIDAAKREDRLSVVHVGSAQEFRTVIEAGADGLAHLVLEGEIDAATVALAREHGVFVTDTLPVLFGLCQPGRGAALAADPRIAPYLWPAVARELSSSFDLGDYAPSCAPVSRAAKQLHDAGVDLLASTDAPNPGTAHGVSMHDELALLVDAGLTPVAALAAATSKPATRFGLDDRGRIRVGARADLVLVAGDPTTDILATRDIVAVYKDGEAVPRERTRERVQKAFAEIERLRALPAPAGSESGRVSDFDDGSSGAAYGSGWVASTDEIAGGSSTATISVVKGGAARSKHALRIRGELTAAAGAIAWAGAMFMPGPSPMAAANLSSKTKLVAWVRGDPGHYQVMLLSGPMPARVELEVGKAWRRVEIPLDRFDGVDTWALVGVLFAAVGEPRRFTLELDDVRIE